MPELRPISAEAVDAALEKAQRYRLLNEPHEAESICHDVLLADPDNVQAKITLLLALTDQFGQRAGAGLEAAQEQIPSLPSEYERAYYAGVIFERWGKSHLGRDMPRHVAFDWIREAMNHYDAAAAIRPPENDDAILRWNTCVRLLQREPRHVTPPRTQTDEFYAGLDDEVPPR
ncbi:MAG: hypothetical protein IIA33_10145 [Planctomycetes bacterium]|nr:hypothetical protein [Planctomycetota bacterium]